MELIKAKIAVLFHCLRQFFTGIDPKLVHCEVVVSYEVFYKPWPRLRISVPTYVGCTCGKQFYRTSDPKQSITVDACLAALGEKNEKQD